MRAGICHGVNELSTDKLMHKNIVDERASGELPQNIIHPSRQGDSEVAKGPQVQMLISRRGNNILKKGQQILTQGHQYH